MNRHFTRILAFIIAFILVVTLPWWISVPFLIGFSIYFPLYLEILFFGFIFDALYSVRHNFPYEGLTIALVFLTVVSIIRTNIRA